MKEEYVTFEQAVALKECGFDWKCDRYYDPYGDLWNLDKPMGQSQSNTYSLAPTLALAQKWMREVKKIDVLVWVCACGYGWNISKAGDELTRGTTLLEYDDKGEDEDSGMWLIYEAALSAGITQALELIKQK